MLAEFHRECAREQRDFGSAARRRRELVRMPRMVGIVAYRGGHLFQRRSGLFEGGGLSLGTLRQFRIARRNLVGAGANLHHRVLDPAHHRGKIVEQLVQAAGQIGVKADLSFHGQARLQIAAQSRVHHRTHVIFRRYPDGPVAPLEHGAEPGAAAVHDGAGIQYQAMPAEGQHLRVGVAQAVQRRSFQALHGFEYVDGRADQCGGGELRQFAADVLLEARERRSRGFVGVNDLMFLVHHQDDRAGVVERLADPGVLRKHAAVGFDAHAQRRPHLVEGAQHLAHLVGAVRRDLAFVLARLDGGECGHCTPQRARQGAGDVDSQQNRRGHHCRHEGERQIPLESLGRKPFLGAGADLIHQQIVERRQLGLE